MSAVLLVLRECRRVQEADNACGCRGFNYRKAPCGILESPISAPGFGWKARAMIEIEESSRGVSCEVRRSRDYQ